MPKKQYLYAKQREEEEQKKLKEKEDMKLFQTKTRQASIVVKEKKIKQLEEIKTKKEQEDAEL